MKVKMHSGCIGQEMVATGVEPPPAPKCQCKKLIDYKEANEKVKNGEASWVIIARTPVETDIDCPLCPGFSDVEKKTCGQCRGSGTIKATRYIPKYNNDIVLLSSVPIDTKNKKYRWNTRSKTPRVATIEKKHIIRAFVDSLEYAVQRIEEYARMIQESLAVPFGLQKQARLGAELRNADTGEIIVEGTPEPADNWHTMTGRKWDQGLPALRVVGDENDALEQDVRVMDPPPSKQSTGGGLADRNGNMDALRAYSLKKIEEGDYQDCGDTVVAAGVSWRKEDLWTANKK